MSRVQETRLQLRLAGPRGEPVDLWRTIVSHGVADLPPGVVDEAARSYETTLPLPRGRPRTIRIREGRPGRAVVDVRGPALSEAARERVTAAVRRMLNLDEDLSGFYNVALADAELSWAAAGAGRMLRSPTVFEDVVKTICTTNCAWSATVRMTRALVDHLGEPSAGRHGRAFPAPSAMADASESFYRDVVRAGYRGAYLRSLARAVAEGELDLESFGSTHPTDLPDADLEAALLALPGVGPYATAHIMMTLGRHSRLILDSWTRPKYARLLGRTKAVPDRQIERRFRPYGEFAGLAFWLFVTRDWVEDGTA
jgi:3-methyladenine DNA glycosylase/8-oxoguanine DNA glycosylase